MSKTKKISLAQGGLINGTSLSIYSLGVSIVNALWIIFTIIAIVMFVIAGILFLTASGEPEKLTKARSAVIWGIVGIIVAILAYTITSLIRNAMGA